MYISPVIAVILALVGCTGAGPADTKLPNDTAHDSDDSGPGDTDTGDSGTIAAPDPVINELMPSNARAWAGPDGTYPDWIELHNPGDAALRLDGWTIADGIDGAPHPLAGLEIAAGGLIVLIADGDPEAGAAHLSFSLDSGGEEIVVWAPDGRRSAWLEFPALPEDVAAARTSGGWIYVPGGSPGSANPE